MLRFAIVLFVVLLTQGCSRCKIEATIIYFGISAPQDRVLLYTYARYYVCQVEEGREQQTNVSANNKVQVR